MQERNSVCTIGLLQIIKWLAVVYSDSYICERKHMFCHAAQSAGPGSCICNYLYYVIPFYSVVYIMSYTRLRQLCASSALMPLSHRECIQSVHYPLNMPAGQIIL